MISLANWSERVHFSANDLEGTITDGGELTHSYSVESGGEVKISKHEIIEMIELAGFEAMGYDLEPRGDGRRIGNRLAKTGKMSRSIFLT